MKSLLLTSITFLVTASFVLAQGESKDIAKIKTVEVKVVNQDTIQEQSSKKVIKVIKKGEDSSSGGQVIIKTISKDGKKTEKQIDFTSMNESEIDHLIDSIMDHQMKDLDIDIQLFGDSKIKVIQLPNGLGENILFEGSEFGDNIDWIDIEDMLEIEEIHKADKTRPFLGVILDDEIETEKGVKIVSVVESGAAQSAGILKEDILIGLDDLEINSLKDIGTVLRAKKVGDEISISVLRNGEQKKLIAKLKCKADSNYNLSNSFNFKMPSCCKGEQSCAHHQRTYKAYAVKPKPRLGLNIEDLDAEMIADLKIKNGTGVLVTKVYDQSAAFNIGLKVNDVITKINNTKIDTVEDLHSFLAKQEIGKEILITYYRYGKIKTGKGELFEFNNYNHNN